MAKDNKNIVSDAILEMYSLKDSIKEESKNTLKYMLSEAVKDAIRESIEDEDKDDDENDYDVVEGSTDNDKENNEDTDSQKSGDVSEDMNDGEMSQDMSQEVSQDSMEQVQDVDTQEAPVEDGEGENVQDDWSNYSQYQAGDENTYDLTGEEDYNQIVKVYKLMKDSDQVVVKQDGNTVQLTDNGTGAEYVIDLGADEDENADVESVAAEGEGEEMAESVIKEGYFDDEDDDVYGLNDEDIKNLEIIKKAGKFVPSKKDLEDFDDSEPAGFDESKKSKKVMKENKELVFEVDLGYTDNYQSKDPIKGLSNSEPSKSGKSWEKGVPTGTEKPWAGSSKDKGEPFEKTVNEEDENLDECGAACANNEEVVDEATNVGGAVQQRTSSKSHIPANRKEHGPKVKRHVSAGGDYDEVVENYKKEISRLKKINEAYKKENAKLKECAKELGKNIQESYVVNTNLAKITRLFTENAVSQKERIDIVNRFANEAKTVEQSKALYESINNDLKKNANKNLTLENNQSMSVEPKKELNENKYVSKDLMNTIDLIKRMGDL